MERGLMSVCLFEYVKVVKFMSVNGLVLCLELKRILKPEQSEREEGRGEKLSVECVKATAERFKWLFVYEIVYG